MSTLRVQAAIADRLTSVHAAPAGTAFGRESPQVRRLLEGACAGDQAAFGELVALHQRLAFRTALAVVARTEEAEEAAQDAFVDAWRKLRAFRGDSTFRTWLLAIVWRKALDRRRAHRSWWRRNQPMEDAPLEALASVPAMQETAVMTGDLERRIRMEIHGLTPKLKHALLLAASGEHTYDEIAAILGLPVGTLKWRVAEARRILRSRLGDIAL